MSKLKEDKKALLLRAAVHGSLVEVAADDSVVTAFAQWVDAKAALALAERIEAAARARVDATFVERNASTLVTPTDTFALVVREREGVDLDKIPADVLAGARTVVRYVQLISKEGGSR